MIHLKLVKYRAKAGDDYLYYWVVVENNEEQLISEGFETEDLAVEFLVNYWETSTDSNHVPENTTIH